MSGAVLIVDDSLTVRMDLADAFEAAGFRSLPCASAREARRALADHSVALVILDLHLPDADGFDLIGEFRGFPNAASAPILMLSSAAEVQDRILGLRKGADEYIGKPYDIGYVVARAQQLLHACDADLAEERPVSVLVIDDSPTFLGKLCSVLEAAGYRVSSASSGEEGLRRAATLRPAAILIDGVLPGIDGATVVRSIRLDEALRGTPCLLLTGSEDREAELRALDAGADAFVRKNEDTEVILARLAAMVRGIGPGRRSVASGLGPNRILAVDDSFTYLESLSEVLRGDGYDVVPAHSGEEALEILVVQPVDCVLLDLIMPGLSGQETCRRIKESPGVRDIPLIILTGLDERDSMLSSLATGADDYISKSSDFEVLKARVRAQLRRKRYENENRRIREELLQSELEATAARAARDLADTRALLVEELERKNAELEAFSYSVSHDLRTPLRSIDGFSQALIEDCSEKLDETGREHLHRIRRAAQRMGELIDDLLALGRVSRAELAPVEVDLSGLAREVAEELRVKDAERNVEWIIQDGLTAKADPRLMRVLFENLLGNAWKFTARTLQARIEVDGDVGEPRRYFVRDNGAGFDMEFVTKLFAPFQRLHTDAEFQGTGIGLATVRRIVDRHGGTVQAEGAVGHGATLSFTLVSERASSVR
jgi:two-component system, NtrC family, sensor kinase